ncbi:DUF6879 family protein [Saccharopolyspora shandongensis]|uniref:DUF6879 family protein n=1 Tax=Saccharopolyspora shandongensis TaxID=418495 RepID=UPI0034111426
MPELRVPSLPDMRGHRLARADYRKEFRTRDAAIHYKSSWKLERRQHFEEVGNASRDALRDGDLPKALRLLEGRRESLRRAVADNEARDAPFHRVRIVEEPLTPYMRWQLHSLRIRAECGDRIRVVPANEVTGYETRTRLPEVVILGGSVLYQVLYTDGGTPNGAVRYEDPAVVESWEYFIRSLYELGEDVTEFFQRKTADLVGEL